MNFNSEVVGDILERLDAHIESDTEMRSELGFTFNSRHSATYETFGDLDPINPWDGELEYNFESIGDITPLVINAMDGVINTTYAMIGDIEVVDLDGVIKATYAMSGDIREDQTGQLIGWGNNWYSQLTMDGQSTFNIPMGVRANSVKQVAVEQGLTLMVSPGSYASGVGQNSHGQARGDGVTSDVQASRFTMMADVKKVVAGNDGRVTLILKNNGDLWGCGYNGYGILTPDSMLSPETDAKIDTAIPTLVYMMSNVVDVSCHSHVLALTTSGDVIAWGNGVNGETRGDGSIPPVGNNYLPTPIYGGAGVKAVSVVAGQGFSLVLLENGELLSWGYDSQLQCSGGDGVNVSDNRKLTKSVILGNIVAISASGSHCLALTNYNGVIAWGSNSNGESRGNGSVSFSSPFAQIKSSAVVSVATAEGGSMLKMTNGDIKAWGFNGFGELIGDGSTTNPITTETVIATGKLNADIVIRNTHSFLREDI